MIEASVANVENYKGRLSIVNVKQREYIVNRKSFQGMFFSVLSTNLQELTNDLIRQSVSIAFF